MCRSSVECSTAWSIHARMNAIDETGDDQPLVISTCSAEYDEVIVSIVGTGARLPESHASANAGVTSDFQLLRSNPKIRFRGLRSAAATAWLLSPIVTWSSRCRLRANSANY